MAKSQQNSTTKKIVARAGYKYDSQQYCCASHVHDQQPPHSAVALYKDDTTDDPDDPVTNEHDFKIPAVWAVFHDKPAMWRHKTHDISMILKWTFALSWRFEAQKQILVTKWY